MRDRRAVLDGDYAPARDSSRVVEVDRRARAQWSRGIHCTKILLDNLHIGGRPRPTC